MSNPLKSFFKVFSKTPWYEEGANGKYFYNSAFVQRLREQLNVELNQSTTYKTDEEVVDMWRERRAHELEDPKLEVVHSAIGADGMISLGLSWNDAFIRMLRANGFTAEDEETLVQSYLASIAKNNADELPAQQQAPLEDGESFTEGIDPARIATHAVSSAMSVGAILDEMPDDIRREFERELRSRAQKRTKR